MDQNKDLEEGSSQMLVKFLRRTFKNAEHLYKSRRLMRRGIYEKYDNEDVVYESFIK